MTRLFWNVPRDVSFISYPHWTVFSYFCKAFHTFASITPIDSNLTRFVFLAMLCVLWWGALDRLWFRPAQSVRVCSTTGYITSGLRGPSPQAITLFGGVGFIARRPRRPEKGNADGVRGIFGTAYRVGLRPCDRTHLKNGLVPYSYAGGA